MRSLLPISVSLLLFSLRIACAQPLAPADDFFNSGAQSYISNNIPAAKERVEAGLQIYPADEKLKKLEELLKQQQQSQQNQQQQNQKQQNQQNQSQQQKQDQQKNQQQSSQSQQKPDEQKPDQSGQKKDDPQKSPEQKSADEKKDGAKPEDKNAEGRPAAPGQMTPEEAKRLLDAQKGDEQVLQLKPQGKPQDNQKPVKDW